MEDEIKKAVNLPFAITSKQSKLWLKHLLETLESTYAEINILTNNIEAMEMDRASIIDHIEQLEKDLDNYRN